VARKKYDDDDGRTIANMNVEGIKGYKSPEQQAKKADFEQLNLTKKERRALFWASYKLVAKSILVFMIIFGLAAVLVWLWLR